MEDSWQTASKYLEKSQRTETDPNDDGSLSGLPAREGTIYNVDHDEGDRRGLTIWLTFLANEKP